MIYMICMCIYDLHLEALCASSSIHLFTCQEQREAQARNVEDFFKYLQGGAGDRGVEAISSWCKFGGFDSIALEEDEPS